MDDVTYVWGKRNGVFHRLETQYSRPDKLTGCAVPLARCEKGTEEEVPMRLSPCKFCFGSKERQAVFDYYKPVLVHAMDDNSLDYSTLPSRCGDRSATRRHQVINLKLFCGSPLRFDMGDLAMEFCSECEATISPLERLRFTEL